MKPVFKVTSPKTTNRSYEYVELDGSQLCELEDSKVVLTTIKSGLTSQTKEGMFEDVFVIQRAQEQFGGAVKFTEAILDNINDCSHIFSYFSIEFAVYDIIKDCFSELYSSAKLFLSSLDYEHILKHSNFGLAG